MDEGSGIVSFAASRIKYLYITQYIICIYYIDTIHHHTLYKSPPSLSLSRLSTHRAAPTIGDPKKSSHILLQYNPDRRPPVIEL